MNTELEKIREFASSFSTVELRPLEPPKQSFCDEDILLMGLMLIFIIDGADKSLVFALLYMFFT